MFRRALHVSELTDEEIAALGAVKIPDEAEQYNHEVAVAEGNKDFSKIPDTH